MTSTLAGVQREEPPAPPPGKDGAGGTGSTGSNGGTWRGLRRILLRAHFFAGVVIGPFLLVAAVTGLLYTVMPQVEQAVYRHELKVDPGSGRERAPLAEQIAAAEKSVPDGTLTEVRTGAGPDDSTRVVFEEPGLREGYTRTAFVNPYDREVLGTLETFGQWLPVRAWFDDLHRNLHLGDLGRNYSEIAASWLWVEVAGGLALWIGARRSRARLRRTLLPEPGAPAGRRRVRSWHGAVGLWAAAGLLGLSATGLTWSAYAGTTVDSLRSRFDSATPAVSTELPGTERRSAGGGGSERAGSERAGSDAAGFDGAVRAARGAGLGGVLEVTPPSGKGTAYTVKEDTRSWPVRQDSVAVDPDTGKVTATLRFDDYPVLAKLSRWGIDAHMGLLFGLPNQIALALLALALIAMILWGYRMWWLRRPGRAPAPGGWRHVPGKVLAPAAVAVALLAYWLPWFGIPLVLFLASDLALGAVRRRRAGDGGRDRTEVAA
ncbi:PepSY-associated TM helix domain-containing protein [Streptomyces albiaxialis]|uniref:PepSY-associated TM helix domain-containing protein n=1 Tax=Streptomyces albiaxialis TaxID=329523 RepID=A0ABP5HRU8_9ACTN